MKGLLLKDWYMMKQYCRTYPVIAVAFMALSLVDSDNLFFVFYTTLNLKDIQMCQNML